MKKILLLSVAALFTLSSSLHAENIGFDVGNNFESKMISGDLTIQCNDLNGQYEVRSFTCEDEILNPSEYAKFQGHKGLDADEVILSATHEDGSTKEKKEDFDASSGLSKDSFNLWISTLFQSPLLDMGKNSIHYTLNKSGSAVLSGSFVANVKRGSVSYCTHRGFYTSNDMNECHFPQNICSRYFYENNYCQ